jgi:type II secretory pathway predicted ATPase ExeA
MINGFFNFLHTPFDRNLPPRALFVSPVLENLNNRLAYAVNNRLFCVVTGDPGSGKTTTIRKFITSGDQSSILTLYVSESNLSPRNFYFSILDQLGVKPHFYRGDAKRQLVKEITPLSASKKIVIILDEAHLCDFEMLTEIRFLLNFDMDSNSPLSLILVGQSELRDTLKKQSFEAIAQRIDLRFHIPPLDRAQTADYISTHLAYAANSSSESINIFTDSAVDAIFQFSLGIPRKINHVASLCLLHAAQISKRYVDDHMVSEIVDTELSW